MAPMFALPTFTFQRRWLFAAVLLSAALFYAGSRTLPGRTVGGLEITAWTVDGGGGVSTGGTFSLYGVAGQPDAGTLTGNTFTLYGGFLHPAVAAPGGSTCPTSQSASIVTNGSGAFNAVWCGQDVTLAALDASYGAPGTNTMSAIFVWDNGPQQFKFWFRGFPIGFQTIPAIALHVGNAYFFQTTAVATIPQGIVPPFTLAAAGASDLIAPQGGAYGYIWAGVAHPLADVGVGFLGAGPSLGISAIFQWDNTAQQFKFWFRGFPIGFQTMIGGVLLVSLIYVLLNVALVRVLGVTRMAGDPFVAATAGHVLFGDRGDLIIRLLVLSSILGGVNATVLMVSRIPLAMSRDGLLPAAFDRVNAGGTPTVSHWVSIGLALGFILSGSFEEVLALAAFFFVTNYAMAFISVFALRRNEPDTPRPYRVPGYPYTTGLVLLGSLAFLVGSYVSDKTHTVRSLLLLAISYPIYRLILWSRRRGQEEIS